jgi:hypothetical protein
MLAARLLMVAETAEGLDRQSVDNPTRPDQGALMYVNRLFNDLGKNPPHRHHSSFTGQHLH